MDLTTYEGLKTAVADYLGRSDLTERVPIMQEVDALGRGDVGHGRGGRALHDAAAHIPLHAQLGEPDEMRDALRQDGAAK